MLATFPAQLFRLLLIGSIFQETLSSRYAYASGVAGNSFRRKTLEYVLQGNVLDELLSTYLLQSRESLEKEMAHAERKVVFPVPEDVVVKRSYLPDLGFLTDLAFLLLPRDFPASGILRLSRDLFESEECVQFVSCEMTKVAHRHGKYLNWVNNFLQDFPFQGDIADRLREGSLDTVLKIKKRETQLDQASNKQDQFCTFSCSPIRSLSRGLKILTLLNDLVRTVKF